MMEAWLQQIQNRLGTPAGASMSADVAAVLSAVSSQSSDHVDLLEGSGNWTVPEGWNSVDVLLVGPGAGGGGSDSVTQSGAGAGGGEVVLVSNLPVIPDTIIPYSLGVAGQGVVGTHGTTGTATTFAGITAYPGIRGMQGTTSTGANGGQTGVNGGAGSTGSQTPGSNGTVLATGAVITRFGGGGGGGMGTEVQSGYPGGSGLNSGGPGGGVGGGGGGGGSLMPGAAGGPEHADGTDGTYGAGGGGAGHKLSTNLRGGHGGPALIRIIRRS